MKPKTLIAFLIALAALPGQAQDMMQPVPPEMKHCESMVGTWEGESTMMGQKGKATMTCEMVLGGRYLKQNHTYSMGGMEFTGILLMGYDATAKEWVGWWFDSAAFGAMETHGKIEGNKMVSVSKPFKMEGMPDMVVRSTMVHESETKMKLILETKQGDAWEPMMEATYTKKS